MNPSFFLLQKIFETKIEFYLNGSLEYFACISNSEILRIQRRAAVIKKLGREAF